MKFSTMLRSGAKAISQTKAPLGLDWREGRGHAMTTNPLFRGIAAVPHSGVTRDLSVERMTLAGTVYRTILLLSCFVASALWSWHKASYLHRGSQKPAMIVFLVCLFAAWVLVWVTIHRKMWSPFTAPAYAAVQGVVIGVVSAGLDKRYPGIAIQAVGATVAMCIGLLFAYRSGLIRVTESFNRKLTAAVSGVVVYYLASIGLALMGFKIQTVLERGILGIAVTIVIVLIAGLTLVSDFDFAVQCANGDLPKYMEWYAALGLTVTLVWLYVEMLRLVSKVRRAQESS
jgi:uncharacterized YccA/Bax inhibitor family protein